MPEIPTSLEIDRVVNFIRGFGWEKKKEIVTDTEIELTIIKKKIVVPSATPT